MYNEIRFFTPLRCDQNDRINLHLLIKSKTLCVSNVNTL